MSEETEKFVNKELEAIGWPTLDLNDKQGVLGCVFSLLKQRSREIAFRHDLQERIRIMDQEQFQKENLTKRLEARLKNKQKEIDDLKRQVDEMTISSNSHARALNAIKEESKKLKMSFGFAKTQYQNEVRKFNLEKERFKQKISRLVNDQDKSQKRLNSMELINPLFDKNQGLSVEDKAQDEMYNIVLANYEEQAKEVMMENAGLRQLLLDFFRSVASKAGDGQDILIDQSELSKFQLPLDLMKDTVESMMENTIDHVLALNLGRNNQDLAYENIEEMKTRLSEQEKTIDELKATLELALTKEQKPDLDKNVSEIQAIMDDLEHQRKVLDEDRRKFTDAAIKMGLERANLQREREILDEEKQALARSQPENLPETPNWLKPKSAKPFTPLHSSNLRKEVSTKTKEESNTNNQEWYKPKENTPTPASSTKEESNLDIPPSDDWLSSENPDFMMEDEENMYFNLINKSFTPSAKRGLNSTEILVESDTLNTPISSIKSVLKAGNTGSSKKNVLFKSSINEGLKSAAMTVKLQNSMDLKKQRSPFLRSHKE